MLDAVFRDGECAFEGSLSGRDQRCEGLWVLIVDHMAIAVCELLSILGSLHLRAHWRQRNPIILARNHVWVLHLALIAVLMLGIGVILRLHAIEVEIAVLMLREIHS